MFRKQGLHTKVNIVLYTINEQSETRIQNTPFTGTPKSYILAIRVTKYAQHLCAANQKILMREITDRSGAVTGLGGGGVNRWGAGYF